MPTVTVDAKVLRVGDLLEIEAVRGDEQINTTLLAGEIPDLQAFATWLINQTPGRAEIQSPLQKRLTITFHVETDTEGNTIRIVDDVAAINLPEDVGHADFRGLPGWATWTGDEAASWIDANVTDLASAKAVLERMARAIIALRDVVVKD